MYTGVEVLPDCVDRVASCHACRPRNVQLYRQSKLKHSENIQEHLSESDSVTQSGCVLRVWTLSQELAIIVRWLTGNGAGLIPYRLLDGPQCLAYLPS